MRAKAGFKVSLNSQLKLDLGIRYMSVLADDFDGWDFDGANADALLTPSLGIAYTLGSKDAKGVKGFSSFAGFDTADVVITSQGLGAKQLQLLRSKVKEVLVAA